MPPESWWGKACRAGVAGAGMPTWSSSSMARRRRSARLPPSCTRSVSMIWKPTVKQGLRLVVGSWKIIAMSLPMIRRRCAGAEHRSRSLAVEDQAVGGDLAGPGDEPHQRQHGDALARAGFADDAEHLALLDREIEVVDRVQQAAARSELDREVADLDQRPSALQLGIEGVAQPVAHQVEGEHGDQDGEAGKVTTQGARFEEFAARRPAWCPIPASAAGRRGRGSRAPRRRGWPRRSAASPGRSAAPRSWAAPS